MNDVVAAQIATRLGYIAVALFAILFELVLILAWAVHHFGAP